MGIRLMAGFEVGRYPSFFSFFFLFFAKFALCIMRREWIDAGGKPAVRHEGVAPSNNLIKDATHRATVFVGPTLKSLTSLFIKTERYDVYSMRYHYEKPNLYSSMYGTTHLCDHPVYDRCTLFQINDKGLAVIQQRYDP